MPDLSTSGVFFPQQTIARKRDGLTLIDDEIEAFVRGATDGSWADYQLSAMLMAVFLRGMDTRETAVLTSAMMRSGRVADLSGVAMPKVDKHSTGGVGDKVSLHLAPMVAACGVAVPMISGRGLGHTGGTLDKLESIPGFRVGLTLEEYAAQVGRIGSALIGQTAELAPADKKLYALRDVTATVECIPLICASIMSKKLAEGIDALVLDVKYGRGAFMREKSQAKELAQAMVGIGRAMGKPTRAVLTAMEEPLGRSVGNALEVQESIECLRGKGPADLMEVTYALGEQMLMLAGVCETPAQARNNLAQAIKNGTALQKFRAIVEAQGGDASVVDDYARFPKAKQVRPLYASRIGYVAEVDARGIAQAALILGAGRVRAENGVDPAVGLSDLVKVGAPVLRGETLAVIHANDEALLEEASRLVQQAILIVDDPVRVPRLIDEVIG